MAANNCCILLVFLCTLFLRETFSKTQTYIVYLGAQKYQKTNQPTSIELEGVRESHYNLLGTNLESVDKARDKIVYSYTHSINGFVATLEEEEAKNIANRKEVVSVILNEAIPLHTTRSWQFLGLENQTDGTVPPGSIWEKAKFGKDTIIGNIDTGVWPESKSFSDHGLQGIPAKWKGICQNDADLKFQCNNKLIGARYFNQGYLAVAGSEAKSTPYLNSPRDADGHGTHTLSTAGGSAVAGANVFGFGNGTATGGSPGARVAAYKVCYDAGCFGADILAAFDAAIGDGVDVLSVSLGGTSSSYARDVVGIGSFHAAMSGILVVASAGNSGPTPSSVCNPEPWIFTVGASTMDRSFPRRAVLGNKKHYEGVSVSPYRLKKGKFYPLISGASAKLNNASADDAELCFPGTLDPKKAKGTIVVCLRGVTARVDKSNQARLAGAVGAIVANDKSTANELVADAHLIPATHVTYEAGLAILNYLNTTRNPVARISNGKTVLGVKPAPVMAAFSSAGPNPLTPQILKPDITAPGVNVLAAFTGAKGPADIEDDKRKVPFAIMSGTSMSCPEVAGVVGLLKTLHPNWSPAAIKSAIMTTAGVISNSKTPIISSTGSKATPFNYGAGHINPNAAADPGLVYDTTPADYGLFLCAMVEYNATLIKDVFNVKTTCSKGGLTLSNLNYPTITIPDLKRKATVTRRVTNVGGGPATYKASVAAPAGFSVTVKPDTLKFEKDGEEKTFKVTVQATGKTATRGYAFGQLTWSDQKHLVASQIVVKNKLGKKIH